MPFTLIAAGSACASMAGLIPFLGFIGKELLYKAAKIRYAGRNIIYGLKAQLDGSEPPA
jgi:formate hydrogenlyase subunit 3/multisubunit Na+/H+ antiporter MnhD subunit